VSCIGPSRHESMSDRMSAIGGKSDVTRTPPNLRE